MPNTNCGLSVTQFELNDIRKQYAEYTRTSHLRRDVYLLADEVERLNAIVHRLYGAVKKVHECNMDPALKAVLANVLMGFKESEK